MTPTERQDDADDTPTGPVRGGAAVVPEVGGAPLGRLAEYAMRETLDVLDCAGWRIDLTRRGHSPALVAALRDEARRRGVAARFAAQFAGEPVNGTERRPALHMALRAPAGDRSFRVAGTPVGAAVEAVRVAMLDFVDAVHRGERRGATGKVFRHVVNIGIGGSDLGPRMVVRALHAQRVSTVDGRPLDVAFVSNIDGQALASVLGDCDPESTLFVVVSKTFTTWETLTNAQTAKRWLLAALARRAPAVPVEAIVAAHFVAVSSAPDAVAEFGIAPEATFGFWDWVGGRYSLWSAVGLSAALAIGRAGFEALLAGAHAIDRVLMAALDDWRERGDDTALLDSTPLRLALADYADHNLRGAAARAVVPYDERLSLWPAYLQQAEMESLGKAVRDDGAPANEPTGAVVFGGVGTDGQHAYFQLLHQGTRVIPVELIALAHPDRPPGTADDPVLREALAEHHRILLASLLAQADALSLGRDDAAVAAAHPDLGPAERAHRVFPGRRPSTVWLAERLTPATLGAMVAIHEHRIFALAAMWGINAFDQWGVELGKALARPIHQALAGQGAAGGLPQATQAAIAWLRERTSI